ncbi:type II toxin-antitoxin system HigB family toxin [Dyadobacter sp. 676]|uniref:Type II toxin-antitoxin system HigB family toxin n=1 Tax=Dyadobacter sp. 676 TaxID=3088362 RepID=A0AAU8FT12_9BACT
MKVHLIRKESIDGFVRDHARSASSFDEWQRKLKGANWRSPGDIRENFPTVDFLGNGCPRVVFDMVGTTIV